MEKNKKGIMMLSAVTEALNYKSDNPNCDNEDIMEHISEFAKQKKRQKDKLLMIASVSKALSILEISPNSSEKAVINQIIKEIPYIIERVEEE